MNVKVWTRGVDHRKFNDLPRDYFPLPRPIILYAGRVVKEKNIEAFLELERRAPKWWWATGPNESSMKKSIPAVVFTGYLREDTYARAMSSADVFVFPSLTDTFGLVMIEAMACGTPVAAFNVASPIDVVESGVTGELDSDLSIAVACALKLDRMACAGVRRSLPGSGWRKCLSRGWCRLMRKRSTPFLQCWREPDCARATPASMMAPPATSHGVIGSPRMRYPAATATTGRR